MKIDNLWEMYYSVVVVLHRQSANSVATKKNRQFIFHFFASYDRDNTSTLVRFIDGCIVVIMSCHNKSCLCCVTICTQIYAKKSSQKRAPNALMQTF